MYVWSSNFCHIFSCACCDHYPTTISLLLSFNCRVLSFSRRGRVVIYECEREIHINDWCLSFVHQLKTIWSPSDSKPAAKGTFMDVMTSKVGGRQWKCSETLTLHNRAKKGLQNWKSLIENRSEYLSKPWMNLETPPFVTELILGNGRSNIWSTFNPESEALPRASQLSKKGESTQLTLVAGVI